VTAAETTARIGLWYRRWRAPLRKFLARSGAVRSADLDDVAQEVFVRLLRYDRAELVEHPQAYLFKMALNVAAEWAIRARNTQPHDAGWLNDLLADEQADDAAFHHATHVEVERALNTLTSRQREVLKLQFTEELGRAEIAARVGTTQRSVKRILMKSYEKLRDELSQCLPDVSDHGPVGP
jgi:RNA polymerase sigma-70 factor (ECF subfamily)